jgi:hypothetical protein
MLLLLQMILNLSPLAVHLQESLTSLRFATKVSFCRVNWNATKETDALLEQVNNTMVGSTKKQIKS